MEKLLLLVINRGLTIYEIYGVPSYGFPCGVKPLGCHWVQVSLESCRPMVICVGTYRVPSCIWPRRGLLDYQQCSDEQ